MRWRGWLIAGALGVGACGHGQPGQHAGGPPSRPTVPAHDGPATAAEAGASDSARARVAAAARRPLATARTERLDFAIMPVPGERSALLVAQDAIARTAFVRPIGHDGAVGPTRVLEGRFVVGAFEGLETQLLTSDGTELCAGPLARAASPSSCLPVRPALWVPLREELVLLEPRLKTSGSDAAATPKKKPVAGKPPHKGSAKHARPTATGKPKASAPKRPAPKAGRKRGKTRKRPKPPDRMRVWLRRVDSQGRLEPEATQTGLSFARPMPGMDLVDAAETRDGARLLWYEHAKTHKGVRRARLRTGRINGDGRYLAATRSTLFEGERKYGFIDGHIQPRLFSRSRQVAYVGRFVRASGAAPRTGFEAMRLRPRRTTDASSALCGVDPFALASSGVRTDEDRSRLESIWQREPLLADGQPRWQAEHVAWVGDRGYFQNGGELYSADRRDGVVRSEAPPFMAARSRVRWAAFDPSGAGLARTDQGYVELARDGELTAHPVPPGDRGGDAAAVAARDVELPPAVRIADSWWALRPGPSAATSQSAYEAVRLLPSAGKASVAKALLHPDGAVLVGGRSHGLIVTRRSQRRQPSRLDLWRLDDQGRVKPLGKPLAGVLPGFDATQRRGGGAIIVGANAEKAGQLDVLVADGQGRLLRRAPGSLRLERSPLRLHLRALPGGGALLTASYSSTVVWLDNEGRELGRADRPAATSGAPCVDGRAAPRWVATTKPGKLLEVDAVAAKGSCVLGEPQWAADGSLRWFGSTVTGIHSRAEVGMLAASVLFGATEVTPSVTPPTDEAAPLPRPAVPPTSAAHRSAPPCPADMVSVGGRFCVDRFETRLADDHTGHMLSPDYPATPNLATIIHGRWVLGRWRTGDLHAKAMPLPPLLRPRDSTPKPVARSLSNVRPSGFMTGLVASDGCRAAGKRLCRPEEFVQACRGEQNRKFPYGDRYEPRACNVYRYGHPAAALHGNASVGHLDPRLNRVMADGKPLLHRTGATPRCRSRWGDDVIYDMVGNLDEWVEDKKGAFAGGFYSRLTRKGCDALITAHPRRYLDYSTGTRCCRDAR